MTTLETLADVWRDLKRQEIEAQEQRRKVEDQIAEMLSLDPSHEGTTSTAGLKITQRINVKIDAERLQELASEAGISEHLGSLFRWRPELNKRLWDASHETIRAALSGAITREPGRPSFADNKKTNESK